MYFKYAKSRNKQVIGKSKLEYQIFEMKHHSFIIIRSPKLLVSEMTCLKSFGEAVLEPETLVFQIYYYPFKHCQN